AFNKSKIKALIFVLLYGISDEIHQFLVPGRESRIRDVFIDLLGGGIGLWTVKYLPLTIQKKLGI
ncbi:MAG: VanZ family protein, partial [Patescibacteria group bacterium]